WPVPDETEPGQVVELAVPAPAQHGRLDRAVAGHVEEQRVSTQFDAADRGWRIAEPCYRWPGAPPGARQAARYDALVAHIDPQHDLPAADDDAGQAARVQPCQEPQRRGVRQQ